MFFNSLEFFFFFILFLICYFLTKGKIRIFVCLLGSYIFYGWWDFRFLGLIIFSTIVDFFIGIKISKSKDRIFQKHLVILSVCINLALLFVFKYFNFFIDSFTDLFVSMGFQANYHTLKIILPVGISFYTFQTMSYSIDLFRKKCDVEKDFLRFATYVAFFPQLVAGPIVRARELLPQLRNDQPFKWENIYSGLFLVLFGLFKKVVVADSLAVVVDKVFAFPENYSVLLVGIGVIFYAFQIYCDFSGYTEIAIGIAKMIGFEFPQNFRTPYFSKGFSEFWRRWHITLSSWLRDYLYISLGGNRKGSIKTYRNLMITMLLGGLWHGANWTFIFWGALHGMYLILERLFNIVFPKNGNRKSGIIKNGGAILLTFLLTCFAWIFFRSPDWEVAFTVIKQLNPLMNVDCFGIQHIVWVSRGLLVIGVLLVIDLLSLRFDYTEMILRFPLFRTAFFTFFIFMISFLGTFAGNQFIYFQF